MDEIKSEKSDETSKNDDVNLAKPVESTFKKPLLVGKIGHLPKKYSHQRQTLCSHPQPTEPIIHESSSDLSKSNEDVKTAQSENTTQKTDNFSFQYKEPAWSGLPKSTSQNYNFEVLKDGSIIDKVNLMNKSFWVFGRLANCDISMQHPTVSRYHAVLQYRPDPDESNDAGFYIYDLGSTHGTFLNKNKLRPRVYVRIQVGHILKLGCSTRNYLLNGPEEDAEEESELSVTELKQKRKEEIEKREQLRIEELEKREKEEEERKKREEERGIDWGLGEDADEETDIAENPYAQSNNEDLYLDDPKKTLRGFFEREGLSLDYDCSEQGMGQFLCKVELPIDDEKGRPIHAEIIHKGKKKEAVIQCALEACRILDRYGLLRQAVHESRKRKAKDWAENDYYDSDDDTFLDRTGEIEKKREKRMNSKNPKQAETYESLMEKESKIADSIRNVEKQLLEAQKMAKKSNEAPSEEDSLDAFMKDLKDSKPDKTVISRLRSDLAKLKQEHASVIKLVNIAKPASLPPLVPQYNSEISSQSGKSKILPLFGKRKKVPVMVPQKATVSDKMDVDEDDDEEEEETKLNTEKETISLTDEQKKSPVVSEPQKINPPVAKTEIYEQNSEYGLKKPNEINNSKIISNQLNDVQSVEAKCKSLLNGVNDKVREISEQIESLEDSEVKKQMRDDLVSLVNRGVENIFGDLNKIKIEKSEKKSEIAECSSSTDDASKKKKNQRRIQHRQEKAEIEKQKGYAEDARKEDYNMWVPPNDQSGDGRTRLNEKFGY